MPNGHATVTEKHESDTRLKLRLAEIRTALKRVEACHLSRQTESSSLAREMPSSEASALLPRPFEAEWMSNVANPTYFGRKPRRPAPASHSIRVAISLSDLLAAGCR